jgi:predicted N-acetyltransferase YhbS
MVLARLAVDVSIQHQRIGHWLVRDALLRILQVSGDVGIRAVLVHLKRPSFASFYAEMDFEVSPIDDTKMFLLMKDLRKALGP